MGYQLDIVGFGDLTYDHIFGEEQDEDVCYIDSRAGGSVFNVLATVGNLGGRTAAYGTGGRDVYGQAAREELLFFRSEAYISLLPRKRTLIIFETLRYDRTGFWQHNRSSFSMTCPICSFRAPDASIARIERGSPDNRSYDFSAKFACFDRLTFARTRIAGEYRAKGVSTLLDLGKSDFIRYRPALHVISALENYDIVFVPEWMALSLTRRAGFASIEGLVTSGFIKVMIVSKGPRGLTLYDARKHQLRVANFDSPSVDNLIDDSGAGDAFLGRLLWKLSELGGLKSVNFREFSLATENSISGLRAVLETTGARGHLPRFEDDAPPIPERWRGLPSYTIRQELCSEDQCPFCLRTEVKNRLSGRGVRTGATVNLRTLNRRMLFAVEKKSEIEKCKTILTVPGTALVVGSGGSFSAATFLSQLLCSAGHFAAAIRPFDYLRNGVRTNNLVVLSYSGATADSEDAIKHARILGVDQIVLVTGASKPKLKESLAPEKDLVISSAGSTPGINRLPRERGFVSIAGTVVPCALWSAAVVGPSRMLHFVKGLERQEPPGFDENAVHELKTALQLRTPIAVMGGGFAWPSMIDLESKFTETFLGNLHLHESKDFSHGRFMSLFSKSDVRIPVIFLHVGIWHHYEKLLFKTVSKYCQILLLDEPENSILGALRLLIQVQHFAQDCASLVEKDISRPGNIPADGLKLYKWNEGLSN
jgi:sugar/nucleoside kinase (ribokinase family)